jgi:hypothetical protein
VTNPGCFFVEDDNMLIVWELDECGDKYLENFEEGGATAGLEQSNLEMARRRRKASDWMSVRWTKLPVGVRATVKVLSVSK